MLSLMHTIRLPLKVILKTWTKWWRSQSPSRQDRFALMAPLTAVIFFFAAIATAFGYLRYEEILREEETVRRDIEYAQQRLRIRLLERQEQVLRLSRDIATGEVADLDFLKQASSIVSLYPEVSAVSWLDAKMRVKYSYAGSGVQNPQIHLLGDTLKAPSLIRTFEWVKRRQQLAYAPPSSSDALGSDSPEPQLQLLVPFVDKGNFNGVFLVEYKIDSPCAL